MTVFTTTLRRIFKQPLNWAFILLFPLLFAVLILTSTNNDLGNNSGNSDMHFGIVDQDDTVLSRTLVQQLGMRYNILDVAEEDISAALTEQDTPWVLLIREGYERDLLEGHEPVLEGYSLTVSDVSALGSVTAANITRALMLLGTNNETALTAWKDASEVDVKIAETESGWGVIAFWFGFFGFVSLFTAYFIVRTLMDDKRGGMPDRLGVLPHSPRNHLIQGTLAAFTATELTAALLLVVIRIQLGSIPNALPLFLLLSLYNLFTVGLVLAIISLAKNMGAASVSMTMFATITSMLGGLFWPLEFAPAFMQKLAWFSPGYWLSRGLQNIEEITFEGYGMPLMFLLGFTVVAILLGGWKRIQALDD